MKSWKKRGLISGVVVIGALVVVFLYVNSGMFLKQQVFPRLASTLDEPVSVDEASLSIFGHLTLKNFRLGPADSPRVQVETLRVRHQLWPLLSGRLVIDEMTLENAAIDLSAEDIQRWQARLAPKVKEPEEDEPDKDKSAEPPSIEIHNVNLRNISATWRQGDLTAGFRNLTTSLPLLTNGQPFELATTGELFLRQPGTDMTLAEGKITLKGDLQPTLLPANLTLSAGTTLRGAAGDFQLDNRQVTLGVKLSQQAGGYKLEQTRLELKHGNATEAVGTVTGAIGLEPLAANLDLHAELPDGNALTLAGKLAGDYDFGHTTLVYDAQLAYAAKIDFTGKLAVSRLSIASPTLKLKDLPEFDLQAHHELGWDPATGTLSIKALGGRLQQGEAVLGELALDKPTSIAIRPGAQPQSEPATLSLKTEKLDTRLLAPFLPLPEGFQLRSGFITNTIRCDIQDNGQKLAITGDFELADLAIAMQDKALDSLGVRAHFEAKASTADGLWASLSPLEASVSRGSNTWTTLSLKAPLQVKKIGEELMQEGVGELVLSVPDLALSDFGAFLPDLPTPKLAEAQVKTDLSIKIASLGKEIVVVGNGQVGGVQAQAGANALDDLGSRFKLDLRLTDSQDLRLNSFQLELTQDADTLLKAIVTGELNLVDKAGAFELNVHELPPDGRKLIQKLAGGADLGQSDLTYKADIGLKGDAVSAKGVFKVDYQPSAQPSFPLALQLTHDLTASPTQLHLQTLSITIDDGTAALLTAGLTAPTTLLLPIDQHQSALALEAELNPFALQRLEPLLPKDANATLKGEAAFRTTAIIHLPSNTLEADGQGSLTKLSFKQEGSALKPITAKAAWRTRLDDQGMLQLEDLSASISHQGQHVLGGQITGAIDTRLNGRQSTLNVSAPQTIDLGLLESLYTSDKEKKEKEKEPETPPRTPEPEKEPFDWNRIWYVINVNAAELLYRNITIKQVVFQAELKNGKFTLPESLLKLNDSDLTYQATADLAAKDEMDYQAKAHLAAMPLSPFMSSFAPKAPVTLGGGFKDVAFDFCGNGLDAKALREQLVANMQGQIDNLVIGKKDGLAADAIEALLLKNFDLSWDDLHFAEGGATVKWSDNTLNLPDMKMTANRFMLLWNGDMTFGDKAVPNFALTPAFRGELADSLRRKGINLTQGERGYWQAPTLDLKGDFYSTTNLIKLTVGYNVALGTLDPKYQAVNTGLDALKSIGGLLNKDKKDEPGANEQPADAKVQDAVKGLFEAYKSYEQAKEKNDKKTQEEPKDDTKKPSLGDVIKLFD